MASKAKSPKVKATETVEVTETTEVVEETEQVELNLDILMKNFDDLAKSISQLRTDLITQKRVTKAFIKANTKKKPVEKRKTVPLYYNIKEPVCKIIGKTYLEDIYTNMEIKSILISYFEKNKQVTKTDDVAIKGCNKNGKPNHTLYLYSPDQNMTKELRLDTEPIFLSQKNEERGRGLSNLNILGVNSRITEPATPEQIATKLSQKQAEV